MTADRDYKHNFKVEDGKVLFYNVQTGDVVKEWDGYSRYKDWRRLLRDTSFTFKRITSRAEKKSHAQSFTDKYGITPSNFLKIFNSIMRKVYIEPVEKFVLRYGFGKSGPNSNKVRLINKHRDLIEQCEADGIRNIIPIVMYTGMPPKLLKEFFGKSTWKYLAGNSETRNKVHMEKIVSDAATGHILNEITATKDLPLWFLMIYKRQGIPSYDVANTFKKISCTKKGFVPRDFTRIVQIYTDTRRMANDLGERFNENWSLRKLQEKHKEFTYKINRQKYNDKPFPWLEGSYHLPEFKAMGCTAKMLQSPMDVLVEGKTMHHCVAGYARRCNAGEYVVYHITDENGEESTLGLHRNKDGVVFGQHYGVSNKIIKNPNCKEFVTHLVSEWNRNARRDVWLQEMLYPTC